MGACVTGLLFGPDALQRSVFVTPSLWVGIHTGINVGNLGISLFFLISGFVILRAVERESPKVFLIRRVFRIYPVSIAAVCVAAIATALYCNATGTVSPHTWTSMLSSAFVLDGFTKTFPVVPVMWSLEVELIFYCMLAALAAFRRLGFNSIAGLALGCVAFTLAVNSAPAQTSSLQQFWMY